MTLFAGITFSVIIVLSLLSHSSVMEQERDILKDIYLSTNGQLWYPHKWNVARLNNGNVCRLHGIFCTTNEFM